MIKKIINKLFNEYHYFILASFLPSFLKKLLIKHGDKYKYIGKVYIKNYEGLYLEKNITLQDNVEIFAYGKVIIGTNSLIAKGTKIKVYGNGHFECGINFISGKNSDIDATGKVMIKDNVVFSDKVSIISHKHYYSIKDGISKKEIKLDVMVGTNSWIGYDSILMGGCIIGNSSIVGAKSLVTAKINSNNEEIIVGIPAKIIGKVKDGYY